MSDMCKNCKLNLMKRNAQSSPECCKGVSLQQLDWYTIPKNCSRTAEAIFHIVCQCGCGIASLPFVSFKE